MRRIMAVVLVGMLLCGCGLRPEAKPQEKQKVKQASQAETDFMEVAVALLKKGEALAAIHAFDEAIKRDPGNVQAYVLLGQTYMHMNQIDQAVDSFRAALRYAPDQGEIYYMLALTNGLRGRKDLAVSNAEKALLLFQKDKDGENFKRALVLLQGLSQE